MNKEVVKIFSQVILSKRTIRIKLLGDSITHGEGGTGFEQNGEPIVEGFARNPEGFCWAKKFKDYMESQFNCVVTNNACTGTRIEFIIDHFDELVEDEDDIVLCMIGTNNRNQYYVNGPRCDKQEYMEKFYRNIIALHDRFKTIGKDVVFMANIPAAANKEMDGENFWRIFHMNDVHDLYVKASVECGFPLIRLYTLFMEYCEQKDVAIDSLLADGLHPNDAGYDVIFNLIMDEIGIARKIYL